MNDNWIESALPLFREACELPVAERTSFLDTACGTDTELRRHVDAMLAWDESGDGLPADAPHPVRAALDDLVQHTESDTADAAPLPDSIGGHRIVRLIAHGGMGTVYEAQQEHPQRRVAIKVAHTAGATTERIRRFELETQLLARLTHPGIAQIIEAGTTGPEDGTRPFFVMEFVEGQPLAAYAAEHLLTARDKLQLMVRICEAVAFAHGQGVVHRDLKPDNVLIESGGKPKVLDFGVAKVEAAGGFGAATMRTEAGRVVGTLGYTAPEQLGGKTEGLGPEADVYSLGVMIYQLLSGRLPHEIDGVTLTRALAVVTNTDAPLLGVIRPEYRGEIEAVVAKALEKDPRYRYADAAALQDDLERFLRGEPVLAQPTGPARRLVKWARRSPALATAVFGLFLATSTAVVILLVKNQEIRGANQEIQSALAEKGRLLDASLVKQLRADADELWPTRPEQADALQDWLETSLQLVDRIPQYKAALELMRPQDATLSGHWNSSEPEQQKEHDTLVKLVADLETLAKETDLFERVRTRLDLARTIVEKTVGEAIRAEWNAVDERMRENEGYRSLAISPHVGLIPLGPDPVTGLEEFLHFETHEEGRDIPTRDDSGRFSITGDTGLIFVLLPGGIPGQPFVMGQEGAEDTREGPRSMPPPDAFFLSKYEMTRGQWFRLTGHNPSANRQAENAFREPVHAAKPVNKVAWEDSAKMMDRLGLTLPDEVQWEFAARAGTATTFWAGDDPSSLAGKENLFDLTDADRQPNWTPRWDVTPAPWRDPKKAQRLANREGAMAPVGSYEPNGFGLYDVAGNLAEWTLHGPGAVENPPVFRGPLIKVIRGSSYKRGVKEARAAARRDVLSSVFFDEVGIRPAMVIRR